MTQETNTFRHIGNRKPSPEQIIGWLKTPIDPLRKFSDYRKAIAEGRATVRQVIDQLKRDK